MTVVAETTECIFCGRLDVPMTKEHAFPKWIEKYIRPADAKTPVPACSPYGNPQPFRMQIVGKGWGRASDAEVKVVCEEVCNNGWMGRLEDRTSRLMRDLLLDQTTALPSKARKAIAKWAVKTVCVFKHAEAEISHTPLEFRHAVFGGRVPDDVVVWLGRAEREVGTWERFQSWLLMAWTREAIEYVLQPQPEPVPSDLMGRRLGEEDTLVLGPLIIKVLAWFDPHPPEITVQPEAAPVSPPNLASTTPRSLSLAPPYDSPQRPAPPIHHSCYGGADRDRSP
jgi:hypothetical protein